MVIASGCGASSAWTSIYSSMREHQREVLLHRLESEALPELEQALLRVTVKRAITFTPDDLDTALDDDLGDQRAAVFRQHRKALHLREAREIAQAQCGRGVPVDEAQDMRRAEIVAVELFFVRAVLLAHENRGAQRERFRDHIGCRCDDGFQVPGHEITPPTRIRGRRRRDGTDRRGPSCSAAH